MSKMRTVEIRTARGAFIEIPFQDLMKDDVFRMKNPSGEPVLYRGSDVLRATSQPYETHHEADEWNEAGLRWTIECISEDEWQKFNAQSAAEPQKEDLS